MASGRTLEATKHQRALMIVGAYYVVKAREFSDPYGAFFAPHLLGAVAFRVVLARAAFSFNGKPEEAP